MTRLLAEEEVEGRLNCFGDFDQKDSICLKRCALNIACAIAKSNYSRVPYQEDDFYPGFRMLYE